MCRKLLFLIALLGLVGTAWADDPLPPDWRALPGSTFSEYRYDNPAPSGDPGWPLRAPEVSSYVPHPEKGDPGNFLERATTDGWLWEQGVAWDGATWAPWTSGYPLPPSYYENNFSMQVWAGEGGTWMPTHEGRTGVLTSYYGASYDIYNFWSVPPQPEKWVQIQMTWRPMEVTEEEYSCPVLDWDAFDWGVDYEYVEEGIAYGTLPLDPAYWSGRTPPGDFTAGFYDNSIEGFNLEVEYYPEDSYSETWYDVHGYGDFAWLDYDGDFAPVDIIALDEGWATWTFEFELVGNPYVEFLGLFPVGTAVGDPYALAWSEYEGLLSEYPENWPDPLETWLEGEDVWAWSYVEAPVEDWDPLWGDPMETWMEQDYGPAAIALDQIVFDTICIPEPVTIALLGLGGLALIRRRKQR